MTAIKVKVEYRTIIDLSSSKYSKNKIKSILQNIEIVNSADSTIYLNNIRVGMYEIHIHFPFDCSSSWRQLKDYKDFEISIFDKDGDRKIILKNDSRFKNQYWVSKNFFGRLKIKHLIDIIMYCQRLNGLRLFL